MAPITGGRGTGAAIPQSRVLHISDPSQAMGVGPFRRAKVKEGDASSHGPPSTQGGLVASRSVSSRKGAPLGNVIVATMPPTNKELLEYDPHESYMISFGIDQQHHEEYKDRSLGEVIKRTAVDVPLSFVENNIVPQNNLRVLVSSEHVDECSLIGIKREIKEQASKVTDSGLLVIFLSGLGKRQYRYGPDRAGNDEWGFVPGDYDGSPDKLLFPSSLITCLLEVRCEAKYILIILDCCYSGAIALRLSSECMDNTGTASLLPHTFVLAAGSANEASLAINSLGYSIFSYFLRFAIDQVQPSSGVLPLSDIFEECQVCAEALSSIVIRYDKKFGLKFGRSRPSFTTVGPQTAVDSVPQEEIGVDMSAREGKTAFIFKYYQQEEDKTKAPALLHSITCDWLESLTNLEPKPLTLLKERDFFNSEYDTEGCVLMAIITLLIHSIASIEMIYNNEHVTNPNIFLVAFVEVMATLDRAYHNINITQRHFFESLPYFIQALAAKKLDCTQMVKLYQQIAKDMVTVQLDNVEVRK